MLRYLTAGESHGRALLGILEGIPSGLALGAQYINAQLKRRQLGYGRGARMNIERDRAEILSGVRGGKTIGSPIALLIKNRDWENWKDIMRVAGGIDIAPLQVPRPGHADLPGAIKYAFGDIRNVSERASARETAVRTALGSVARKFLEEFSIYIGSAVLRIGSARAKISADISARELIEKADASPVRCLDKKATRAMIKAIDKARKRGDALGGIFEVRTSPLPVGLGSFVHWDRRLEGRLAQAIMSLNGIKGVEIGLGFDGAKKFGSKIHDEIFCDKRGKFFRKTNNSGGIDGGMTTGEPLIIRAAMKPLATLGKSLRSVNIGNRKESRAPSERSDVCAAPSAAAVAEALVALVLADAFLEKFGGDSIEETRAHYETRRYK